MISTIISKVTRILHLDTHKILFDVFERNSGRILDEKIKHLNRPVKKLLEEEDERQHYGDIELTESGSQNVIRGFTIDRIRFIHDNIRISENDTLVDLGDSNGIFIRSMNRDGISVNISDPALKAIHAKQIEVIKADIEHLPFKAGSIDHILLFETLEHVPNPIALLNEIGRVCRKSLVLSIPFVSTTTIHRHNYDPIKPLHQHHIFEFSPPDFKKILTHTRFTLQKEAEAVVLNDGNTLREKMIFFFWRMFMEKDMYCGCFKKFYMCILSKEEDGMP
ncbi:MAG: hypothetical protein APR53_03410 [Methanoculleus sp. SDB]|nr:MAG: hypothetical protein APR53_03410 [Methanoculleus sp. SDB]